MTEQSDDGTAAMNDILRRTETEHHDDGYPEPPSSMHAFLQARLAEARESTTDRRNR